MKVENIRQKDGKVELAVELDGKETTKEMTRIAAYEIGKGHYKVDSAKDEPIEFLRKTLGADEAAFRFDEGIMRHRVPFALTAAEIDTIGEPVFKCLEHAEPGQKFVFHMVCVPVPEFSLTSYDPVTITAPSYQVKEQEVDMELQKMAEASATGVTDTSHDVVIKGDKVELAMETTHNGEKVRPLCSESREYSTGTFAMPDDFDNAIVGMKVGETKSFTFNGPELELDANGKVQMEPYDTTVTLKRIISMETPELTDEWARTTRKGIKNLNDLKKQLREEIADKHEDDRRRQCEMLAGNELAKRLEGEISDLVYSVALAEAKKEFDNRLRRENTTMDAYLKQQGIDDTQFKQSLLSQVRAQLTRQFALNAYARHEKLAVDDEDLDAFFESIAPGKAGQAKNDFRQDGRMYAARCAALRLKAARDAVDKANIKTIGQ